MPETRAHSTVGMVQRAGESRAPPAPFRTVAADLFAVQEHLQALAETINRLESRLPRLDAPLLPDRAPGAEERVEAGGVLIEHHARKVYVDGTEVQLSPAEYRCLHALVRNAGRVVTHRNLLRLTTNSGVGDVGHLKVYIARLRAKLRVADAPDRLIESVWGVGYRLAATPGSARLPHEAATGA